MSLKWNFWSMIYSLTNLQWNAVQKCHTDTSLKSGIKFWSFLTILPGTEVPRATKAMALTESLRKMKQPKCPATSPMTAVHRPIIAIEITKQGYPLAIPIWWAIQMDIFTYTEYNNHYSKFPGKTASLSTWFCENSQKWLCYVQIN